MASASTVEWLWALALNPMCLPNRTTAVGAALFMVVALVAGAFFVEYELAMASLRFGAAGKRQVPPTECLTLVIAGGTKEVCPRRFPSYFPPFSFSES